jgi:3-hydroxybutyryl-CoA dehydrogenase
MIEEIRNVLYVGAGTMGGANSLVAAVSGYDVVLHDAREETLQTVSTRHDGVASFLVQSGYCSEDEVRAGRDRLRLATDLEEAAAQADLVSESVFENRELKRSVHRQLDAVCPSTTILTTNTSSLLVSDIEDVVKRGDRFAALHTHLGSFLVDIVGGPRTTPWTIDVLRRYVLSLGAVPLVLNKEHRGYVFNAMNGPVMGIALRLVLEAHATREEVDRAWMSDRQAPMGPFGMMDLFGLDLMLDSWRQPSPDPQREALRSRVVPFLTDYVDAGRLGLKSGRGFYDYSAPAFREPAFVKAEPVSRVASEALVSTLVRSALSLAEKDIASTDDIDLAWTTATGLPIGPFGVLDALGTEAFREMLDRQVALGLCSDAAGRAASRALAARTGLDSGAAPRSEERSRA